MFAPLWDHVRAGRFQALPGTFLNLRVSSTVGGECLPVCDVSDGSGADRKVDLQYLEFQAHFITML